MSQRSLLSRLMNSLRLSGDEDEDDYYLDDDDDMFEEDAPRKSFFSRRSEEDDYDDEVDTRSRYQGGRNAKVVQMKRGMEVTMIKPTSMEDSREVCDYLLAGKAVVLNLEGIHMEVAQRIIDFTSGATYSMEGNLQKISNYIFIATPRSVELSGDFQDLLSGGNLSGVSGLNMHL